MNKMKHTYRSCWRNRLLIILLSLGTVSCEDYLNAPTPVMPGEEGVEVELSFGFADGQDGYTVSGKTATRSGNAAQNGAFRAEPVSAAQTRADGDTPDLKPDALYGLHVLQYKQDGTLLTLNSPPSTPPVVGMKLSYTLVAADDCQLVIIARGKGNTTPSISGNLSNIQKQIMASDIFKETNIPTGGASQDEINKMPYILHLPHVKVTSDGKLQSIEGAHDARLLLKRLATKLTVHWKLTDELAAQGYAIKEVKLCQVPVDFRLLPAVDNTEWGATYPSSISEFAETYRLTDAADLDAGTKTVWIPANVRGTSVRATSPYYRTKENAPTAASYVELTVDNSTRQERLYYRAYLGGKEPNDFNLYENTDYDWTLNVTSANYRDDSRIQLLDQAPVTSTNFVPTSNCLMMLPGTNICFNPYKHEAGTGGWNTYLTDGSTPTAGKNIERVRVLWQTKDAGTSGELVMGYVVDKDNHKNLVNTTDIGDINNALVHVKVPVTQGGNAVIEAVNSSGVTVWSWHIWISDYVPVPITGNINASTRTEAIATAQNATQGGMVQVYGGISWVDPSGTFYKCVIMDRNLGATKAGIQDNLLDRVRTFGLLYQGGRKDPFFSTADGTAVDVKIGYDGYGNRAILDKPYKNHVPYQTLIENPLTFYHCYPSSGSNDEILYDDKNTWGTNGSKTIYDPCPKGWKVPSNEGATKGALAYLWTGFGSTSYDTSVQYANNDNVYYYDGSQLTSMKTDGGISKNGTDIPGSGFLYIGGSGESKDNYTNKSAFYPGVSLRETRSGEYRTSVKNNAVYLWSSTDSNTNRPGKREFHQIQNGMFSSYSTLGPSSGYGFSVRCIQNNEQ